MDKSFSEFIPETNAVVDKIKSGQTVNQSEVLQTIFEGESWVGYLASKNPGQEMYAIQIQISLLESLFSSSDTSLSTVAKIILKAKYAPGANTHGIKLIKNELLKSLSDSQLILLKETIRSAQNRLNQYDSITTMKLLNKNRVLIDDILLSRPDPKTKLNGLLE